MYHVNYLNKKNPLSSLPVGSQIKNHFLVLIQSHILTLAFKSTLTLRIWTEKRARLDIVDFI